MCNFIYDSLLKAHHEEVSKIENNTAGGWNKFWSEAIQSLVSHNISIVMFSTNYKCFYNIYTDNYGYYRHEANFV